MSRQLSNHSGHAFPDVVARIQKRIAEGLSQLSPHLRAWAQAHVVTPRVTTLFTGLESSTTEKYWLVTDATGKDDGSCQVIYTEDLDSFGLSVILQGGRHCCMGFYGEFADAIESM
jgi:hypothetical protein